jgi:hypothetical protein
MTLVVGTAFQLLESNLADVIIRSALRSDSKVPYQRRDGRKRYSLRVAYQAGRGGSRLWTWRADNLDSLLRFVRKLEACPHLGQIGLLSNSSTPAEQSESTA